MEDQYHVTSDSPGFAPVSLRILEDERITDGETIAVFAAIASFIDYGTGDCHPGLETIGNRARITGRAVQPHIEKLVSLGYIQKVSVPGRSNRYHLIDPWGRTKGRKPASMGSEVGFQGGRKPASTERDSMNKTQERYSSKKDKEPSVPRLITDYFWKKFQERTGLKPVWKAQYEGFAKKLSAVGSVEKVSKAIDAYFDRKWWFVNGGGYDFGQFFQHFNEIASATMKAEWIPRVCPHCGSKQMSTSAECDTCHKPMEASHAAK